MTQQRRRLPSLLALRVFECSARHLSFTKAADELCVTQAAVSHQIIALEKWLGVRLFKRLNKSIKLTDAGARYAPALTQALDMMAEATKSILAAEGLNKLSVSTLDSFASIWLLPRLNQFRALYPDLDVQFHSIRDHVDLIEQGDTDLEIRYGVGNWPGLHVKKILDEEIFPVCSPRLFENGGRPKTIADLKDCTLLHDTINVTWKDWFERFDVSDAPLDRGYSFNHSHLVVQACINGDGVALGRSVLVQEALKEGRLIRLFDESMLSNMAYYIVCRKGEEDLHHIRTFALWMISEASKM